MSTLPLWKNVSGIKTLLVEKHDSPLITIALSFPVGAYLDPEGKAGLANFFADMLLRGTRSRSREQIEEELDYLGASLVVDAGFHTCVLRAQVLNRNLDRMLDLVSEILTEPTFPEKEITPLRDQILGRLRLRLEDDSYLARKHFFKAVYEGHPYSTELRGTEETLSRIGREDIEAFFKTHIHRDQMVVGMAGDLSPQAFEDIVGSLIGRIPKGTANIREVEYVSTAKGRNAILVDKPARTQSHFFIGQPGIPICHPDFFALSVFVNAFGGHMFQAKYFQEIRVKRGWSYGAYGSLDTRRDGGSFYMFTYPATKDTVDALKLSIELLEGAISGNVLSDDEIKFGQTYMARSYPFMVDTPEEVLGKMIQNHFMRRPENYLSQYVENIQSVTVEQTREAAKKHLNTKDLVVSLLCTAEDVRSDLEQQIKFDQIKTVAFNA